MSESQPTNRESSCVRLDHRQRKIALVWFATIVGTGLSLFLLQKIGFDFGRILGPCGLKQRTGYTCPTCGMTTATLAFVRGQWLLAWQIQPAAGFFCTLFVLVALGGLWLAVTGLLPRKLAQFYCELKWRYILLCAGIIVLAGWAVTLVRAWKAMH